jgi:hypothetical protein
LHTEEIVDPARLDTWLRHWAASAGEVGPDLRQVPATALVMASMRIDFNALLDAVRDLVPDVQQTRLKNLLLALDGVLLGQDLQSEILPSMGPGVLAYMEPPAADDAMPDARLAKVSVINLGGNPKLAAALENGLRTLLAFYALDPRHGRGQLEVESRVVAGRTVTALSRTSPFAFAVDRDRLILGSSALAVAHALSPAAVGETAHGDLSRLRSERFPGAESFVYVDLLRLHRYIVDHRGPLVERLAARQRREPRDMERDLDQAAALMALFQQGYLSSVIEPDATAVHREIGLMAHTPPPAVAP